jgi:hypothetical protein
VDPPAAAAPRATWRARCRTWRGWGALRYLLIWPLFRLYRDCVRRSLRWRLAESHLLTVFLSVLIISLIGGAALVAEEFIEIVRAAK